MTLDRETQIELDAEDILRKWRYRGECTGPANRRLARLLAAEALDHPEGKSSNSLWWELRGEARTNAEAAQVLEQRGVAPEMCRALKEAADEWEADELGASEPS
jgi:hypothetical protein